VALPRARLSYQPVLTLKPEGLILGAGTVLLPAEESRRLKSVDGDELRVLALLSAAYGRAIAPRVLGNIQRAAKAWSEGDDCLAYIHLAHAHVRASRQSSKRIDQLPEILREPFLLFLRVPSCPRV